MQPLRYKWTCCSEKGDETLSSQPETLFPRKLYDYGTFAFQALEARSQKPHVNVCLCEDDDISARISALLIFQQSLSGECGFKLKYDLATPNSAQLSQIIIPAIHNL